MNRTEFMSQLGFLLRNISDGEKEEALQYYNDYFDDAGAENEQTVIEALGNPARVAENIRRELLENQGGKPSTPADRAIVEYGKAEADGEAGAVPAVVSEAGKTFGTMEENGGAAGYFDVMRVGTDGGGQSSGERSSSSGGGIGGRQDTSGWSPSSGGTGGGAGSAGGRNGAPGRSGMSGGMTVVLVILAVIASPLILGLLSVVFGLLMAWFGLILGFGVASLCLFLMLFLLLVVGGMCIPVDPLVGLGVMGGGLICGGLGLLFLMLTVAIAGVVPAIFRGIGRLFRRIFGIGRKKAESFQAGATY